MTISQNEYCYDNACTVGPHSVKTRLSSPAFKSLHLNKRLKKKGETGLFFCSFSWFMDSLWLDLMTKGCKLLILNNFYLKIIAHIYRMHQKQDGVSLTCLLGNTLFYFLYFWWVSFNTKWRYFTILLVDVYECCWRYMGKSIWTPEHHTHI